MAAQFAYYEDDLDLEADYRTQESPISKRLLEAARGELSSQQKFNTQARFGRRSSKVNGVHRRGGKRSALEM